MNVTNIIKQLAILAAEKQRGVQNVCCAPDLPPAVENDRPSRDYLEAIKLKLMAVVSYPIESNPSFDQV